jgi:hypothetical protein
VNDIRRATNPTQVPNQTISSGTWNFSDNNALAASNVVISGSASVTFVAGNCIDLQPGFHATAGTAGTTFHAWVETAPTADSVSPSSGSGPSQQFTWKASSPSGYTNLSEMYALFNTSVSGQNACYIRYNRASNLLYLADNSGTSWLGGLVPGTSGTAANSQCSIAASGSSVSGSGTQLTLTVSVTFQASFSGPKNDYLITYDNAGLNSEWQPMGTWTVPAPPQYCLTTAVSPSGGGTVSLSPTGPCYNSGTVVTVSATANPGYQFSGFSGDLGGPTNPQYLTMNGPKSVTANFTQSPPPLTITTASPLPSGTWGVAYSPPALAASGGTPPYTWSVASGLLPAPLTLSSSGVLSGTPERGGQTFGFAIQVRDSLGVVATKDFTLAIGPTSAPIAGPSRLEAGLSYMPFDNYDFAHSASSYGFPFSCPAYSSVRSCFQTVLANLRAQGVSGVRIFFGLCGPDSTPLVNCGQPWTSVHYAGSNSTWIQHVTDFFTDAQNAGILNITLTPAHIGGTLYTQAKALVTAPGGQVCSDTPDPVYFYPAAPLGYKPVIDTAGPCNPGCPSGYTCDNGTCKQTQYHPIHGDNQASDGGYNCSPKNPFFVGWQNQYDVIDAMLGAAAQVAATQPDPAKRITIFELDFEQELDLMDFPVLARFIVDNAQTNSGQPNVRDALRYYMGLNRNGIAFDPTRVTWSAPWASTWVAGNQATGVANCTSVYAGFARTMGADQIASAIGQGGAWIGLPGDADTSAGWGLVCGGNISGMVGMSSYSATQPSILDVHLRPCVGSPSAFCLLDDASANVQNEAKIDFDDIVNYLARVPGTSTVVLGETHSNTQAQSDTQDAQGSAATRTCEGGTLNAPAQTVAGYNQSTLAGRSVVFRPWMQLQSPSGDCFSHPSNQRMNFQGAGPYTPTQQ